MAVFKVLWGSNLDMLNLGCILVAFSVAPTTATSGRVYFCFMV